MDEESAIVTDDKSCEASSRVSTRIVADLAQQVERIHGKDEVAGSSPAVGIGGQF